MIPNTHSYKSQKQLLFAGWLLVAFSIMQYLVAAVGFIIGVPIGWATILIAFACAFLAGLYFTEVTIKKSIVPTLSILFGIAVMCWVTCLFTDNSFDGNHYHQEITVYLLNGWNPWYTYCPADNPSLWSMTYPKGIEICEATIVALTGVMETAKVFNFIFVTGCALMLYCFLKDAYPNAKKLQLGIITIVTFLNPVVILQMLHCLNDYVAYCLIILTAICSVEYCRTQDKKQLIAILLFIIFAASVKALSFFYVGLTLFFVLIWLLYKRKYKIFIWLAGTGIIGAVVAIVFTSWHPYMTNLIHHGNILYPLLGDNTVDIMSNHVPENFRGHNRFHNWFWSLLTIDWPYNYSRAGGFGPLMWFLILSTFVTTLLSLKHTRVIFYAYIATILSTFCFEEAWWARYIPQLWLVVPLGGIAVLYFNTKFKTALLYCLSLCVLLTLGKGLPRNVQQTLDVHKVREAVYESCGKRHEIKVLNMQPSIEWQFAERGITAIKIDSIPDNAYVIGITEPLLNRFNACVVVEEPLPEVFTKDATLKSFVVKEPKK